MKSKIAIAAVALSLSASALAGPPTGGASGYWTAWSGWAWSMVYYRPCTNGTADYGVCGW
jgi:hypothetical protein